MLERPRRCGVTVRCHVRSCPVCHERGRTDPGCSDRELLPVHGVKHRHSASQKRSERPASNSSALLRLPP